MTADLENPTARKVDRLRTPSKNFPMTADVVFQEGRQNERGSKLFSRRNEIDAADLLIEIDKPSISIAGVSLFYGRWQEIRSRIKLCCPPRS
jgi:hypothetical protein